MGCPVRKKKLFYACTLSSETWNPQGKFSFMIYEGKEKESGNQQVFPSGVRATQNILQCMTLLL